MSVTRADIQKIADLAELAVDEAAAAELEQQLTRILDYVAQLQQMPEEAGHLEDQRAVRLRKDVVAPDALAAPPAAFAPALKQGLFVVPRIAELAAGADE